MKRTNAMIIRLIVLLVVTFRVSLSLAESPVSADEEPESPQSDIYYNAMIKSIDLDRNRWKPFSRSLEAGPWFYDSTGLIRTGSKVIASVTVFPHPMKTAIYSAVYGNHIKIRKIVFETEINCATHTYRQPLITAYDYYNEILVRHSNPGKEFSAIKKGTTTDTLQSLICVTGARKKR
jgi:hypothetical protein